MGNSQAVTAGNKAQANSGACEWYTLLNINGTGEFIDMMKKLNGSRDYTEMDNAIREKITPYLLNGGEGDWVPVSEIQHVRNCLRLGIPVEPPQHSKSSAKANGLKSVSSGTSVQKMNRNGTRVGPVDDLEMLENGNHHTNHPAANQGGMRYVCWDLYQRGPVGETLIHLCLLLASPLTAEIAKRLLYIYPGLAMDIYLSEQYYGENILHIAIVNEDPAMVKFILNFGKEEWPFHMERCYGNFFWTDDQIGARKDIPGTELMNVPRKTNYKGYIYWGEYPLSFAACLGQEECLRLLLAKGADPCAQDHNGNTVLHMLVIHNNIEMFNLVLATAKQHDILSIKNKKGLTPLTLAAEMAHKEMYDHILESEREVYWVYGDVTCAAYPLADIDSIDVTGNINPYSALHLIIHGDSEGHLNMVDGMIVNLLKEKWKTFARFRFYRRFIFFCLYFAIFVTTLILRPGTDTEYSATQKVNLTLSNNQTLYNVTPEFNTCYLMGHRAGYDNQTLVRFGFEVATLLGAITYLFFAARNIFYQGKTIFLETLLSAPSLALFFGSCGMVLLLVPGRLFCSFGRAWSQYEDIIAVLSILPTASYFLFFCRGFKIVGPFVVMIYKMVVGDLLRFCTIYLIFLISFSQAMFIVFLGWQSPSDDADEHGETTPFSRPDTAVMGMFYMSMGEFSAIYQSFDHTRHPNLGKFIFVIYMVLVTLLLVNMLIAMMGNTYTLVNETQKEWLRQWASIVLTIEQSVTPDERSKQQKRYSQPMGDGRRALAVRWHQTAKEKEELHRNREELKLQQKEKVNHWKTKEAQGGSSVQSPNGIKLDSTTLPRQQTASSKGSNDTTGQRKP